MVPSWIKCQDLKLLFYVLVHINEINAFGFFVLLFRQNKTSEH